jgi:hypothetical protein
VRRRIPWIIAVIVLLALLAFLVRPVTPARHVAARFTGYRMSMNGYRVAQFTVTNGNEFPVRCRFWLTPPYTTDSRSQAMFDPEYEVIPSRSTFRLEGAARPRFPLLPPYSRGTNLPAAEWVLCINVWDARPPEEASRFGTASAHFSSAQVWNGSVISFLQPGVHLQRVIRSRQRVSEWSSLVA